MGATVERYLLLGLRLGRHVEGLVDAYYGPAELAAAVECEPLGHARGASRPRGARSSTSSRTAGWATRCAGSAPTPACWRERAARTPTRSRAATASVRSRPTRRRTRPRTSDSTSCSRPRARCSSGTRAGVTRTPCRPIGSSHVTVTSSRSCATGRRCDRRCPRARSSSLESVRDEPWWAFNYYLGGLRSRVVVNVDVRRPRRRPGASWPPTRSTRATTPSAALKEQRLVRDRGLLEESILLVPTPQSLVGEGIAETGPGSCSTTARGRRSRRSSLARPALDPRRGWEIRRRVPPLRRVGLDAALMLHEEGREAEARAHVERWASVDSEAGGAERPLRHRPDLAGVRRSRTRRAGLCGAYVGGDPARFRALLTEQVRVGDLAGGGIVRAVSVAAEREYGVFIDGESAEGSESARARRAGDRRAARHRAARRRGRRRPRGRRGACRARRRLGARRLPTGALAAAARARRRDRREPQGARRARDAQRRQGDLVGQGGARRGDRELPLLRLRDRDDRRPLEPDRRLAALLLAQGAGRRRRRRSCRGTTRC